MPNKAIMTPTTVYVHSPLTPGVECHAAATVLVCESADGRVRAVSFRLPGKRKMQYVEWGAEVIVVEGSGPNPLPGYTKTTTGGVARHLCPSRLWMDEVRELVREAGNVVLFDNWCNDTLAVLANAPQPRGRY